MYAGYSGSNKYDYMDLEIESASEPSRVIHQISSKLANPMDIPFGSTFDKASCGWHACIRHTIFLSGCFRKAN